MMDPEDSVTNWFSRLANGDAVGANELWQRYYSKLVSLARKKLRASARRVADEEDIALSAFHSFCRGAEEGRFPDIHDRDDLWRLLVVITARKAGRQVEYEHRKKRGSGDVRGDSVFFQPNQSQPQLLASLCVDGDPPPDVAVSTAEQLSRLLQSLGDDNLRTVALLKMEGYKNQEIAESLECSLRTVERRLRGIRSIWREEL